MREVIAIVAREWRIVRKPTLVAAALSGLCLVAVVLMTSAGRRYQLFDEEASIRSLPVMGAIGLGLLLALASFLHELSHGTWAGLLLLPFSRGLWLSIKLGLGLALVTAGVMLPPLVLRTLLELSQVTGGPLPGAGEVLAQVGGSVLVGVATYLAASAGLLSQQGPVVLVCHAAIPLVGFFAIIDRSRGALPMVVLGGLTIVLLVSDVLAVLRWGRPVSGPLFALRVCAVTPASLLALLCAGLLAQMAVQQARPRVATAATVAAERPRESTLVIDENGHIISAWSWRRGVDMVSLEEVPQAPLRGRRSPRLRQWQSVHSQERVNIFQHPERGFLRAYDNGSGRSAGCIGQDGLHATSCRPFEGPMQVLDTVSGFLPVVTPRAVFAIDTATAQVIEVYRGDVTGVARAFLPGARRVRRLGVAILSGADLLIAGDTPPGEEEGDTAPPGISTRIACAGLGSEGRVEAVALESSFVGARVRQAASEAQALVVCRDGVVVERQVIPQPSHRESSMSDERADLKDALFLATLGPVLAELAPRVMHPFEHPAPAAMRRRWGLVGAAISVIVMASALVAQRRRDLPRSQQVLVLLGSLLLGPGYALACLLLLSWRRPAAGALVT